MGIDNIDILIDPDSTNRNCYFCKRPIPDDEKAIQAKTKNAWAHFECWYDGTPFPRDPHTGRQLPVKTK